jgi:hypothetical protein
MVPQKRATNFIFKLNGGNPYFLLHTILFQYVFVILNTKIGSFKP